MVVGRPGPTFCHILQKFVLTLFLVRLLPSSYFWPAEKILFLPLIGDMASALLYEPSSFFEVNPNQPAILPNSLELLFRCSASR